MEQGYFRGFALELAQLTSDNALYIYTGLMTLFFASSQWKEISSESSWNDIFLKENKATL